MESADSPTACSIKTAIQGQLQKVADFGRHSPRLETGGGYQDTEMAYTMRQRAAQEINGGLLNARSQFLGKESLLFHS